MRNGQYRTSRMCGNGHNLRQGKERWFGREGQPPGPLMMVTHLTLVGVIIWLGDNRRMAPINPDGLRMPRVSHHWGASLRRKKNGVIVRFWMVSLEWWRGIRRWNRSRVRSGMGAVWLLLGAIKVCPDGGCGRPESVGRHNR